MGRLNSRDLKTLVEICSYSESKNQLNESVRVLVPVNRAYCKVEPVSIQNYIKSGAEGSALVARILFRDDIALLADQFIRVIDSGAIYKINGVIPINEDRKQAALCSVSLL